MQSISSFRAFVCSCIVIAASLSVAIAAEPARSDARSPLPAGLEMLRRTERAFAKATSEIGVRNGFLMFFADDAIAPPKTAPAREGLLARPAPVEPPPTDLEWEPLFGDIATSGDLGYLTGPASFSDGEGKQHTGVYFSIWRRNSEGLWRVVLDAGIDMPSPAPEFTPAVFRAAKPSGWQSSNAPLDVQQESQALEAMERVFQKAAATSMATAYAPVLADESRLHREGKHPVLGRAAILADLKSHPASMTSELLRTDISAAADLGWTFGTCALTADGATKKGAFTHVWRRDARGAWRLVADVVTPERE